MSEKEKIDALLEELATLPAISNENARKLEDKFRLEFNFNSNHIEGNTLTYGETKLLLIFDKTDGPHEMREFEEMKAHDVAYRWIKELAEDKAYRLIERDIKQLNEIILVRPFWKDALTPDGQATRRQILVGEYKKHPNSVQLQNGEMFHYASPADTPIEMHALMDWFHAETEKNELSPVELAAIFHYKFVSIHPFDDGNGRISRLLMNYVLLKHDLPPVIIKSADKKNYLNALNQADAGNLGAFVKYIAQQLIWSLEIKIKATKGASIEEEDDIDKQVALFKKEQLSIAKQIAADNPEKIAKVYYNTVRNVLIELSERTQIFNELFESNTESYYLELKSRSLDVRRITFSSIKHMEAVQDFAETEEKVSILWKKELVSSLNRLISNIIIEIRVNFNQDIFIIELKEPEITFQFSYNKVFSDDNTKEIVNKIYKGIFNLIQANTKK
ncbi:Fic family protein [Emticicia soli]|uniref:Fic family protein n=1 Tax=Emticicia soli TaxID=2027878 RepID=A0ABW5JCY7_9BACT